MTPAGRRRAAEALVVAIATTHNWASHRRLPRSAYVPANLAVAASLVAVARWGGASWDELGLDPGAVVDGVRTGLIGSAAVAGVVAAAAAVPGSRFLFDDEQIRAHPPRAALYETVVRIPLGTAVAEELAFRSALLGLSWRARGWRRSVALTSALFGLWHVFPAMDKGPMFADGEALDPFPWGAVWLSVIGTAAGGMALARLRRRSGSVVAPVLAHTVANITAFLITRRRGQSSSSFSGS